MSDKEIYAAFEKLKEWSAEFDEKISKLLIELERKLKRLQKALSDAILKKLLQNLFLDDKKMVRSIANMKEINNLESVFSAWSKDGYDALIIELGKDLLEIAKATSEYYAIIGFTPKQIKAADEGIKAISYSIGIDVKGKIVPDGYLARLKASDTVKAKIKDYALNSIVGGLPVTDFTRGLEKLVNGSEDKDGVLASHFRTYAYDSFNQTHEAANKTYSESLGMDEYFVYEGSVIATTRPFCAKKAGKVFTKKQAETWKNDSDLVNKDTKSSYVWWRDRGRYNCRHQIRYVPKAWAEAIAKRQNQTLPS